MRVVCRRYKVKSKVLRCCLCTASDHDNVYRTTTMLTTTPGRSRECTVLLYVHVGTFYLLLMRRSRPLLIAKAMKKRTCSRFLNFSVPKLNCFGGEENKSVCSWTNPRLGRKYPRIFLNIHMGRC